MTAQALRTRQARNATDRRPRIQFVAHRLPAAPHFAWRNDPTGKSLRVFNPGLSSPSRKNFPLNMSGKSPLQARPVPPDKGADRESSRTRGGMRWTRQRRARKGSQGGFPVSDRPARGRTALPTILARTRRTARGPAGSLAWTGADGEVVWSRRPDAGVKSCGRCIRPDRVSDASSNREATVATKPGHRGEREVSRNPFAQGKPERSG